MSPRIIIESNVMDVTNLAVNDRSSAFRKPFDSPSSPFIVGIRNVPSNNHKIFRFALSFESVVFIIILSSALQPTLMYMTSCSQN